MPLEQIVEVQIENLKFTYLAQVHRGIPILSFNHKKGGFIFLKKFKESYWIRFARWIDKVILRNIPSFQPTQWVDITWFENNKPETRSYNFIPVNKSGGKEDTAPEAASIGMLHCFYKKENIYDRMPDYIRVQYRSVFGHKSFIYQQVQDHEVQETVISSLLVCKNLAQVSRMVQNSTRLH